jgi:hypothetical protein
MSEDKLSSLLIISFEHYTLRTAGLHKTRLSLQRVHKVAVSDPVGLQGECMPCRLSLHPLNVTVDNSLIHHAVLDKLPCAEYLLKYYVDADRNKHIVELHVKRLEKVLISEKWETDKSWNIFGLGDEFGWRDPNTMKFYFNPFEISKDCGDITIIKKCVLGTDIEVLNSCIGLPVGVLNPLKRAIIKTTQAYTFSSILGTNGRYLIGGYMMEAAGRLIKKACTLWRDCAKLILDLVPMLDSATKSSSSDSLALGLDRWRWLVHSQLALLDFADLPFVAALADCLEKQEVETAEHMLAKEHLQLAVAILRTDVTALLESLHAAEKMSFGEWRQSGRWTRMREIGKRCEELRRMLDVDMAKWMQLKTYHRNSLRKEIIEQLIRIVMVIQTKLIQVLPRLLSGCHFLSSVCHSGITLVSLPKSQLYLSLFADNLHKSHLENLIYASDHYGYSILVNRTNQDMKFQIRCLDSSSDPKANKGDVEHSFSLPATAASVHVIDQKKLLALTTVHAGAAQSKQYFLHVIILQPLLNKNPGEVSPQLVFKGEIDRCQTVTVEAFTSTYGNLHVRPSLIKPNPGSKFGEFRVYRWENHYELSSVGRLAPESIPTLLGDFYAQNIEFKQFGKHLFIFRMNSNKTTTFVRCLGLKADGSTELICRTVIDTTHGGHEAVRFLEQGSNVFLLFILPGYNYRLMALHCRRLVKICKEKRIPGTYRLESTQPLGIVDIGKYVYMHTETVEDIKGRKAKILKLCLSF